MANPDGQPTERLDGPAVMQSVADSATVTGGQSTAIPQPTPVPTGTGRYELLDEVARGGMGIVYRATDTVLGREVAVKVLHEQLDESSEMARRFLDEARIAGQLQHPGIPAVHDLGTLPDGRPFLAMKLVKGQTLDQLLKKRADPGEERGRFVAIFEQVCQAVGYAHAHQVIHRDLKPANVMVGAFGEVQVMDWGLAKVLTPRAASADDPEATTGTEIRSLRDGDGTKTQAGSVLGTLAFMPPEQVLGAVGKVDVRSDVFGLGAILAVILTGKPPFESGSVETIRIRAAQGKLDDCFARLDGCGADPELVALCKHCLSPDQADRPSEGGAVARAVAALRAAADERARQAELERVRAGEQRKRRREQTTLALSVIGLVAAAAFGVVVALFWQRAEGARAAAELARDGEQEARKDAETARDAKQVAREKVERLEYSRTIQMAHQQWRDNNVAGALGLLGGTRPDLRGWEWDYVHRLCHSELLTLKGHTASYSPDGTRIITASPDGTAKVWDAKTGAEILTLKGHENWVYWATFSPDGTRIVTASQDTVKVWDARTGAEALTLKGHTAAVRSAMFSPDGTRIVTASDDVTAKVWDARTGAEILTLKGHTKNVWSAMFSPDGTRIVTASLDRTARVWDARTGAETLTLKGHTNMVFSAMFSPDGTRIVTGCADGTARVWDARPMHPDLLPGELAWGDALLAREYLDEAIAAYKKAIRLSPRDPPAANRLGLALARKGQLLQAKGDLDGAIAAYQEALRIDPNQPEAPANLTAAKRLRELLPRLPDIVADKAKPRTPDEGCAFAFLCGLPFQKRYADAVRLLQKAFAADPRLAETPRTVHRYKAACYAALAARGEGVGAPREPQQRAALRARALAWLKADLAFWKDQSVSNQPQDRKRAEKQLARWVVDEDLRETRPEAKREGWTEQESRAWDQLWWEVRQTQADASMP
jgi:tetratricopeptide (TPR) repeat protein/tRNA A-37 threonylcarbamoyl transferase component Bud32